MLYTILQTSALILTLESAIFLIKGNFTLSAQSITELSGTYWSFNPYLVESLCRQTMDARVGSILLVLSFFIQMISLWKGPTLDDLGAANHSGLLIAITIGIIIFVLSWLSSVVFSKSMVSDVKQRLAENNKKGPK